MQRLLLRAGLSPRLYGRMAAGSVIGEATRKARPELVTELASRAQRVGRRGLLETIRSVILEPGDALDRLASLTVPWEFVAGRDDYVLAGGTAEAIANLGPLHLVDGGHTTPLESPVDLTRHIERFLDSLD